MGVTKGFNFQASDVTFKLHVALGHSRLLVSVQVDRPHNDFVFVYVGVLGNKGGS